MASFACGQSCQFVTVPNRDPADIGPSRLPVSRAKGTVVKSAALGFGLILFALPFASRADESLVAKREACRQEAKVRIAPVRKIGIEEYRRIVERRNAYVGQCMGRAFVARKDPQLPPKKAVEKTTDRVSASVAAPVQGRSHRVAKRTERKRLKTVSAKPHKGKRLKGRSLKGKRLKRASRRNG